MKILDLERKFFFDEAGDRRMEGQNQENWKAVAGIVQREAVASLPRKPWDILDIGCHTGGLLDTMCREFTDTLGFQGNRVRSLAGIEPLRHPRETAQQRLSGATLFEKIEDVPAQSVDVAVGHEFLYLVPDLRGWISELRRILRPEGGAYISLGSHGENKAWLRWRDRLEELYGHASHVYMPLQILDFGCQAGFDMELHRLNLQPTASRRYSPPGDGWGEFISAEEMLNFQQQKYVFVFYPRR